MVEIAGPAGSGKTTLVKELECKLASVVAGVSIGTACKIEFFLRNSLMFMPTIQSFCRQGRWLDRADTRSIIYLAAWHHQLGDHSSPCKESVILLDQGPVYRLARLREFGSGVTKTRTYDQWSEKQIGQWANTLDIVIWLDAPNSVLSQRIDARKHRHRIQGQPSEVSHPFLVRYRESHQRIISNMLNITGGPQVLRFDTEQEPASAIADDVLRALDSAKSLGKDHLQTQP